MTERERLEQAIAALEAQRATLGDAVVDTMIAAARKQLDALEPAPTEQQRKQVTILFADVSGFTAMSEALDAEEVSDVMNALWQQLDAVIVEHGGAIDKHMGDAVMALWGIEEAREDDPERAIRAALAMQAALAAFRDDRQVDLAMRIGLNTGPVLLGGVGTKGEFSAIGDAVNLASRLEHAAPVGRVLISHGTYRHVRGVFDVLPQEPIRVKGKAEPVRTYVVQRAKPRTFRMPTRGVEGIETRMVGRDAELLTLQNTFYDTMEDAETRVVTIVGEAGVGKSRLLYEFGDWIELLPEQIRYLKGRATPEMQTVPHSIIRRMLAFRFEILESDTAATVLRKFRAGMAGILGPDQADLVGHLVGFDFSASKAVRNLLGSESFAELATAYLTNYVRAVASEPTVMFLEDVHWADDSSLDLLDHLATAVPDARLLMVCLTRPPLFERRPSWGEGWEAHIRIDLRPLSRRASRALVAEVLQKVESIPTALRDLVVDRAEGNPFYVEELIKMLIEDGVIRRGEEQWHAELERLAEVRIPSTLTGVLQARLDSLSREERTLLQRASVVGRLFWDAAVAELEAGNADKFDLDKAEIAPLLEGVRNRELVFRRERSAFERTDEYIFKHALLRDVTYETVLLKLRRVYHAQVAAWLEANAGERLGEYLSLIAGHYELSGEQAKGADFLYRSGEELLKVSAFRDAIRAFGRALAIVPGGDKTSRAALLVKLGRAHRSVGEFRVAAQHFEEGLALAREAGDAQTEVAALNGQGQVARDQGEHSEAKHHLKKGLALARESDNLAGAASILGQLSTVAFSQGDGEKAARYAEDSLKLCRELGDRRQIAIALSLLGAAAWLRGEHVEYKRILEENQALYRELGDRWGVAASLHNMGEIAREQGDYGQAKQHYEEALAVFREIGSRYGIVGSLVSLGHICAVLGKGDAAWEHLREALQESLVIGAVPIALEGLAGVSLLRARAGQYAQAADLLGLVLGHPAIDEDIRRWSDPVLDTLREALPAGQLEAAMERGRSLNLEEVVAEILGEAAE